MLNNGQVLVLTAGAFMIVWVICWAVVETARARARYTPGDNHPDKFWDVKKGE